MPTDGGRVPERARSRAPHRPLGTTAARTNPAIDLAEFIVHPLDRWRILEDGPWVVDVRRYVRDATESLRTALAVPPPDAVGDGVQEGGSRTDGRVTTQERSAREYPPLMVVGARGVAPAREAEAARKRAFDARRVRRAPVELERNPEVEEVRRATELRDYLAALRRAGNPQQADHMEVPEEWWKIVGVRWVCLTCGQLLDTRGDPCQCKEDTPRGRADVGLAGEAATGE